LKHEVHLNAIKNLVPTSQKTHCHHYKDRMVNAVHRLFPVLWVTKKYTLGAKYKDLLC